MAQSKEELNRKARERQAAWRKTPDYQRWLEESRERRKELKAKYRRQSGAFPKWMTAKRDQHVKEYQAWQKSQPSAKEAARLFFLSIGCKVCGKCGLLHGVSDFYKAADKQDGLMPICKTCDKRKQKYKRKINPLARLKHNIQTLVSASLRNKGYTKSSRTHQILGCDFKFFVQHIERQFAKGMTWEKIGTEIHIDHIVPLATAQSEQEVIALNHYTNLRPCWASENLAKSSKLEFLL